MNAPASAPGHAAAAAPHCLNCLYTLSLPRPIFCGHCGQETDLHPPSMHEFIHEYVGHYVALEGPLWRSLWALVLLPGRLTREYFAGRRRRYVLPLRIYLTASFLFFVVGHLLQHEAPHTPETAQTGHLLRQSARAPRAAASVASAASVSADVEADVDVDGQGAGGFGPEMARGLAACLPPGAGCGWLETQLARGLDKLQRTQGESLKASMGHAAPYAMLLMQPVFALILLMIFAGSGRRYAEHFVFSLHIHAFWFLALLLDRFVDATGVLLPTVFVHGLIALRAVYGRGWWANVWRSLLASLLYLIALGLGAAALAVLTVLNS